MQSSMDKSREELIKEFAPRIKILAARYAAKSPPTIDINDLINAGILGLLDAMDKFDPSKGVKFSTYAEIRIRGAILDELRKMDWASRSIRDRINKLEEAYRSLERKLGRMPTDREVAEELGITEEELQREFMELKGYSFFRLEDFGDDEDMLRNLREQILSDKGEGDPYVKLRKKELAELIYEALKDLSAKEKIVLALYYYEELTMKEIGSVLGIGESRVSQIHSKAIFKIKKKLKEKLGDLRNLAL